MTTHTRNADPHPPEMVAVFESLEDARQARLRLLEDDFHAGAISILQGKDALNAERLEVVRSVPSRATRMAFGLSIGLVLGGGLGLYFFPTLFGGMWQSGLLGGAIGVLWGVTLAGLAFGRVKDDRKFQIEKHLKNGRAVLLVTGTQETVDRARRAMEAQESNGPVLAEPDLKASA
ncbi:hypothetical protein Pla175_47820 [Pirellulimonas nuda]|uniref:DUF1269 domain-containing protein n=1 Tax=Pirellulimonas nuda TaxID=2528009 RepID=A0A518DIQ5_9BACT|nr:hypothetical protein [Pirellulimonas nuda]QDU91360.1 hypothetical protein Pla175_47820 [Pirellulimonas nuda]